MHLYVLYWPVTLRRFYIPHHPIEGYVEVLYLAMAKDMRVLLHMDEYMEDLRCVKYPIYWHGSCIQDCQARRTSGYRYILGLISAATDAWSTAN